MQYFMLILHQIFNQKQKKYKYDKIGDDPLDAPIIFLMQGFVFFIGPYDDEHETDKKKGRENQLSSTEHILYFYANLM